MWRLYPFHGVEIFIPNLVSVANHLHVAVTSCQPNRWFSTSFPDAIISATCVRSRANGCMCLTYRLCAVVCVPYTLSLSILPNRRSANLPAQIVPHVLSVIRTGYQPLAFRRLDANQFLFYRNHSSFTNTLPTSGYDGVRQPSLQNSAVQRGKNILEPYLLIFNHYR